MSHAQSGGTEIGFEEGLGNLLTEDFHYSVPFLKCAAFLTIPAITS
jgi:hypothetical protein